MALINCPECGREISEMAKSCPHCGCPIQKPTENKESSSKPKKTHNSENRNEKPKKKGSCLKIILIVLAALMVLIVLIGIIGGGEDKPVAEKTGVMEQESEQTAEEESSNSFSVGDIVETDYMRITFVSADQYIEENEFMQPKEGYEYWRFEFNFENISDTDQTVSSMMDWECYADNQNADQTWLVDDSGLDATLSPGRTTQGAVYFEIPEDAESIEIEYSVNLWTDERVVFVVK